MVYKEKKEKWTKDGRSWYFRCYYTDLMGNRKQKKSAKFLTKKEASEAERMFLNSLKDLSVQPKITFKELKEKYLEYQKDHVRITTYKSIKFVLTYTNNLDKIVVSDFSMKQFENWKKYINSFDFSTTYKNDIYKRLRSLLNFGNKMYNIDTRITDKFTNFTNPNELKKEMLYFTKKEFDKFIDEEDDLRWICFFSTLFYCGLRQGEALALNWNDVNWENKTITISKTLTNKLKGKNAIILPPKTKGSYRTIPVPPNLFNNLKNLLETQKKYTNFEHTWFVFGDIFPLSPTTIQKRRDKLCNLANVKRIRIHDFRHSCASLLIHNGANINLVAKYLGHSNTSTTLNIYSHFYQNDLSNLIKNIEK